MPLPTSHVEHNVYKAITASVIRISGLFAAFVRAFATYTILFIYFCLCTRSGKRATVRILAAERRCTWQCM